MLLTPPIHLAARLNQSSSRWELALRYIAATAATLVAIAGAQLITPNSFIWSLTALTLIGVPVSLWLRLSDLKIGNRTIPRPILNSITVLLSFGAGAYFVFLPMSDFFLPLLTGNRPPYFWLRFGGGEPIEALMRLFLLFAAFRSFALISDKDATLTTVPSFSVLLLLIPIHKGVEVVVYFIAWTFIAAILFALDHRSEVREGVSATVPSVVSGQDVKMGARSLGTILGVSLFAAIGVSIFIASRDPQERSTAETAVTALATRLTNMALAIPEISSSSGPERQIDFKNGPNLPSRAPLWQVSAWTAGREPIYPTYWRMFTLSNYNGTSWTQGDANVTRIQRSFLSQNRWPSRRGGRGFGFGGYQAPPAFYSFPGYDVGTNNPSPGKQWAKERVLVRQRIISQMPNIGFLPVLPVVRAVVLGEDDPKEIRSRTDGALDLGVVQINQQINLISDVPMAPEYGLAGRRLPLRKLSEAQIRASGVRLSAAERANNLRLPPTLPQRVRDLSSQMRGRVGPSASNFTKAQRIALSIQEGAVYTLRPPTIPDNRDATDFFLFEGNRRGYCTYFAGALTVLCRAQGIPARVVSGFGGIEWQGQNAGLLREGNAHAWTEIWVEGIGWTVVDATPPGDRGDNSPTWLESWGDWVFTGANTILSWIGQHRGGLGAVVLMTLATGLVGRSYNQRGGIWCNRQPGDDSVERQAISQIYRRTSRRITRKFRPKFSWETPDEWLQSYSQELSRTDAEALRRLTSLYLTARYNSNPLPSGSAKLAKSAASSVSWKRVKNSDAN